MSNEHNCPTTKHKKISREIDMLLQSIGIQNNLKIDLVSVTSFHGGGVG